MLMQKRLTSIDSSLLSSIVDIKRLRKGAYNIRKDGKGIERKVTNNINIVPKEDKPGIADEVALGVTYHEIDDYLEGKEVSAKAQETIETWWRKGQHKRHLPITIFDDFWK